MGHRREPPGWACRWLPARLAADGISVLDVSAKLATRVRVLSTGHARKNDDADAVSVGVAAPTAARRE
jgi:transposase